MIETILTVAGITSILVVVAMAALGAAGYVIGVRDDDELIEHLRDGGPVLDDETGDDVIRMLAAWRDETAR